MSFMDDYRSAEKLRFSPLDDGNNYAVGKPANVSYYIFKAIGTTVARILYQPKLENESRLLKLDDVGKGAILVTNHDSGADPFFFVRNLKSRLHTFALDNPSWDIPLLGTAYHKVGVIPVAARGNSESTRVAKLILCKDWLVLMFPEANFVHKYRQIYGRTGFVRLSWETRKPIVPLGIRGIDHHHFLDFLPPLNRKVTVNFGRPRIIRDEIFEQYPEPNEELILGIRDEIMREIRERSHYQGLRFAATKELYNYYQKLPRTEYTMVDPDFA